MEVLKQQILPYLETDFEKKRCTPVFVPKLCEKNNKIVKVALIGISKA